MDALELLLTYNSAPILYQASKIQHDVLSLADPSALQQYQSMLLCTTTLLARHLTLALGCTSAQLHDVSSQCVALQVAGNAAGCRLMGRIFPRGMLPKAKCLQWKLEAWQDFFAVIRNKIDTATEQWNQDCREELVAKLKANMTRYINLKRSMHEQTVRWNVEEFRVAYSGLEGLCRVGGFYLANLVSWTKLGDKSHLQLTAEIADPLAFWNVSNSVASRSRS